MGFKYLSLTWAQHDSLKHQQYHWIPKCHGTTIGMKKSDAEALPDKKDFINESLGSVVADGQTQRMRHVEISSDPTLESAG